MVSRCSAKPKLESGTTLELAQTRLLAPAGFDASALEGLLSGLMKPGIRPPPSLIRAVGPRGGAIQRRDEPAPAGSGPVVLGPARIGQPVASPLCTVVDDGTIPNRRGSLTRDDEGTPTHCTTLIGNDPQALSKVSMLGTDLKLDNGIGVCGKESQSVSVKNSPSDRFSPWVRNG